MGERYWITGVQLGIIKAHTIPKDKLVEEIIDKQFIGNILANEYDKYEIVIRKKKGE